MAKKRKKYRAPSPHRPKQEPPQPEAQEVRDAPEDRQARELAGKVAVREAAFDESQAFPPNGMPHKWRTAFMAMLVAAALLPPFVAPMGVNHGYTPDLHMSAYAQVAVLVALSLFALTRLKWPGVPLPRVPILLPIALLIGWGLLSILWARSAYFTVMDSIDWTNALLIGVLALLVVKSMDMLKTLIACMAVAGGLMATLGLMQYLVAWPPADYVPQFIAPGGTFNNKNMFAQYVVITMPAILVLFLASRRAWLTWATAIGLVFAWSAIFFARARGSWLAAIVQIVVATGILIYLRLRFGFNPFAGWGKKIAGFFIVASTAGMLYLSPNMFIEFEALERAAAVADNEAFSARSGYEMAQKKMRQLSSAEIRLIMWANSTHMIRDHWLLGVGLGNWTAEYDAYQSAHKQDPKLLGNFYHANAHNDYVEILAELGIIGFGLFLWVLYELLRVVGRVLGSFRSDSVYMLAPVIALSGMATNAMFSFPMKQPTTILIALLYILVLGMYCAGLRRRAPPTRSRKARSLGMRAMVACFIPMLVAGSVYAQTNFYKSEVHYRKAIALLKGKRFGPALNEARQAKQYLPFRPVLSWIEASALLGLQRPAQAIPLFNEVLAYNPYSATSSVNLAVAYATLGRHKKAAEVMMDLHLRHRKTSHAYSALQYGLRARDTASVKKVLGQEVDRLEDILALNEATLQKTEGTTPRAGTEAAELKRERLWRLGVANKRLKGDLAELKALRAFDFKTVQALLTQSVADLQKDMDFATTEGERLKDIWADDNEPSKEDIYTRRRARWLGDTASVKLKRKTSILKFVKGEIEERARQEQERKRAKAGEQPGQPAKTEKVEKIEKDTRAEREPIMIETQLPGQSNK